MNVEKQEVCEANFYARERTSHYVAIDIEESGEFRTLSVEHPQRAVELRDFDARLVTAHACVAPKNRDGKEKSVNDSDVTEDF